MKIILIMYFLFRKKEKKKTNMWDVTKLPEAPLKSLVVRILSHFRLLLQEPMTSGHGHGQD